MVAQLERFAFWAAAQIDFRQGCRVVGSALCSALVAVASLRIRHLFLLPEGGDLPQIRVELTQFKPIGGILLVLAGCIKRLVVFSADKPDDFSLFAFLFGHWLPRYLFSHPKASVSGRRGRKEIVWHISFFWGKYTNHCLARVAER